MATDSFADAVPSFPLPSQECKDARKYQEQGHYTDDNKQQEFTEEVWFHQLVSTHGPNPFCIPDPLSTG